MNNKETEKIHAPVETFDELVDKCFNNYIYSSDPTKLFKITRKGKIGMLTTLLEHHNSRIVHAAEAYKAHDKSQKIAHSTFCYG